MSRRATELVAAVAPPVKYSRFSLQNIITGIRSNEINLIQIARSLLPQVVVLFSRELMSQPVSNLQGAGLVTRQPKLS